MSQLFKTIVTKNKIIIPISTGIIGISHLSVFFWFDKIGGKGLGCTSASECLSNHVPGSGYNTAEHMHKEEKKSLYANYRCPRSCYLSKVEFITGFLERTFWKNSIHNP